jgi:hypothetical protein
VADNAVDRGDHEEDGNRKEPETGGPDRLAGRQSRKHAVAVGDCARVAVGFPDENRDDRKGDDEHQRGKRHVAGTPPVSTNDGVGEPRHQRGANPNPGHRNAKREAAALVEPRRHSFGVRQRRLPRAEQSDKTGHRDEHCGQGRGLSASEASDSAKSPMEVSETRRIP